MMQDILKKVPNLHIFGVGRKIACGFLTESQFLSYQEKLLNYDKEDFNKICKWLATRERTKNINQKAGSYKLKHIAEKEIGIYIPNGAFIAAAIESGFKYKIYKDFPSAFFNIKISKKDTYHG